MEINEQQVGKAVAALIQHTEKQKEVDSASSTEPFEKEIRFQLQVGFKKTPPKQSKPVQLTIPHSLFVENDTEICLFTKDPQADYDKLVEEANIDGLKKVISAQTLRKDYKTYEAKRNLCDSYDLFLADARVLPSLTKHLGSKFFIHKKQPMPIKFQDNVASLTKAVNKSKCATFIRFNGGPCSTVYIGYDELSEEMLTANVVAALKAVGDKVQGGWKNVQSAHLKTETSIALPIYQSLPGTLTEGKTETGSVTEDSGAKKTKAGKAKRTKKADEVDEADEESAPASVKRRKETEATDKTTKARRSTRNK